LGEYSSRLARDVSRSRDRTSHVENESFAEGRDGRLFWTESAPIGLVFLGSPLREEGDEGQGIEGEVFQRAVSAVVRFEPGLLLLPD
jgi:hypothetical protein